MAQTLLDGDLLGAHVPVAGGLANAPANGRTIGATAIQVFTRSQRRWENPPLLRAESRAFAEALPASGVRVVLSHASYLINLASTVPEFRRKSRRCLVTEIRRCHALGIRHVVLHPGAHMGAGEAAGLRAVARGLDHAFARTQRVDVSVLLEVTAGQGSCLGHRFEHLAEVIQQVRQPERVGVCLDTCHLLAAGYDLATEEGYERTLARFEAIVGWERVRAVHLNDSLRPLGSRVDRHAPIGTGCLGTPAFRRILNDRRFRGVPMVVETPGPLETWRKEIALLRGLRER